MSSPTKIATMSTLDATLAYAARGWAVFPCRRDKKPLTAHGFKDASRDESVIRDWWGRWPDASIGIACGALSGGLVVLDCDEAEFVWVLENTCGPLPETHTVATGRGTHRYFISSEPIKTQRLAPLLELRGEGSYILAPPSLHPNGSCYRVINDVQPAPLPRALSELLSKSPQTTAPPCTTASDDEKIHAGERNSTLTSLAGSMRRRGMSHEAIEAALLTDNACRGVPPLPEEEVRKIAASVARYEPGSQDAAETHSAKNGAVDYAIVPAERGKSSQGGEQHQGNTGPYNSRGGRTYYSKQTGDGVVRLLLSNFVARISQESILDDGRDTSRAFEIMGVLAGENTLRELPRIRVPAERFPTLSWVTEQWGAKAVIGAGLGTKDRLREAIQLFSGEVPERRIFTHTGWRQVDGIEVFLHAGGAVGANGLEVELPSELRRYALPDVPENPREAMELSLRMLDLAPLVETAPLWAANFRAVLASVFPLDVSIFLFGPTGVLKTTLAALFLSHFGNFSRTTLPGAWSSTANALEHRAFVLNDVPFLIDDFAPSPLDAREMEAKAGRLLRAQGNLSGRGRLTSDIRERATFAPRGLVIATGEQLPSGQSILARTLLVEVQPGAVNLVKLSELQETVCRLPHAMASCLGWLAPQVDGLPKVLAEIFAGARARAHREGQHLRVPEALAHLWIGAHTGMQFAEEVGAVGHDAAERLRAQIWEALLEVGTEQTRMIGDERPSRRFFEVLNALMVQGHVSLLPKNQPPDEKSAEIFIGWHDKGFLFLLPDPSFRAVAQFCRDSGEAFPVRRERLFRDLKREGLSVCEDRHATTNARVGGALRRVLKVDVRAVERLLGQSSTSSALFPPFPLFEGGDSSQMKLDAKLPPILRDRKAPLLRGPLPHKKVGTAGTPVTAERQPPIPTGIPRAKSLLDLGVEQRDSPIPAGAILLSLRYNGGSQPLPAVPRCWCCKILYKFERIQESRGKTYAFVEPGCRCLDVWTCYRCFACRAHCRCGSMTDMGSAPKTPQEVFRTLTSDGNAG